MKYEINILKRDPPISCILEYLNRFEEKYDNNKASEIIINFNDYKFISPSALCILNIYLYGIKKENPKVDIKINNILDDIQRYMSRLDFYKNLGIENHENFNRQEEIGRFTTIKIINEDNKYEVIGEIMNIIVKNKKDLPLDIYHTLDWSIGELIDNVFEHSESDVGCMFVAQNYKKYIELCIVDKGIGIDKSLGREKEYNELDPEEVLKKATEKAVTRGTGQGNGLYYTKKFIELNRGEMQIFSNSSRFRLNDGIIDNNTKTGLPWKGTIVGICINKNTNIDITEVFNVDISNPQEKRRLPVGYLDDERLEDILW